MIVIKSKKIKSRLKNKIAAAIAIAGSAASAFGYLALAPVRYSKNEGQYWEYVQKEHDLEKILKGEIKIQKADINGNNIPDKFYENERRRVILELDGKEYIPENKRRILDVLFAKRPDPSIIKEWPITPDNSLTVYTSDNPPVKIMSTQATRIFLKPDELPETLKRATILTEDKKFYTHSGINWSGKLRMLASRFKTAGSGITEQVAKGIFTQEGKIRTRGGINGILGKAAETLYARKIDSMYTKNEILTFYLNNAYFGDGNYGVASASKDYFGKEVKELTECEAFFLVRLIQNPGSNPKNGGREFQQRKYQTLMKALSDSKDITQEEYTSCTSPDAIKIRKQEDTLVSEIKFPSTIATLVGELESEYGIDLPSMIKEKARPFSLDIYTTVKSDDIKRMQAAVRLGLKHPTANAAFVSLDKHGRIQGILGGRKFTKWSDLNLATQSTSQIGSTIKPIIYAIAYENDIATPEQIFTDDPGILLDPPSNWDQKSDRTLTLEDALAQSNNIISWKVLKEVKKQLGYEKFLNYISSFGMDTESFRRIGKSDRLVALGSAESTVLQVAATYRVFLDGEYIKPTIIDEVVVAQHKIKVNNETKKVFRKLTVSAIKRSLRKIGIEIIGMPEVSLKTGTTNDYKNAWLAGLEENPELDERVFAILVRNNDGSSLGEGKYARTIAAPIIRLYLKQYVENTIYKGRKAQTAVAELEQQFDETNIYTTQFSHEEQDPLLNNPEQQDQNDTSDQDIIDIEDRDGGLVETNDDQETCKGHTKENIETTLSKDDINSLYKLKNDMMSCSSEGVKYGSRKWAYYITQEGKAEEKLGDIYRERKGTDSEDAKIQYRNAVDNYKAVIDHSYGYYSDSRSQAEKSLNRLEAKKLLETDETTDAGTEADPE